MRHAPLPRLMPLLIGATLSGCAGWNNLPNQDTLYLDHELWDARGVIPTEDGLYVPLPEAGALALLAPNGEATRVDVGQGRVTRVTAAPDQQTVVAFLERYRCEPKDPDTQRGQRFLTHCDPEDRVVQTEMGVVRGGEVRGAVDIEGPFNAITYANDGRYAVAYLDFSDPDLRVTGVVSLTSVVVLDLESGESTPVSVGFAADQVLFVHNAAGDAEKAVVLSRNSVAVVDLIGEVPTKEVTFPLTLDVASQVVPVGVELTPSGQHALISVENRADLYALDLWNRSINIVELSGAPADMSVNPQENRTVLVYRNAGWVDVLEHDLFTVSSFQLHEPMNRILDGTDFALLYSTGSQRDAYLLDLADNQLQRFRLENPAQSLSLAPTEEFAIALTRPGGGSGGLYDSSPGMEILDLGAGQTQPFLLEGMGLGVAWAEGEGSLHALILQENVSYLYMHDLYTGRSDELELSAPPVHIGALPDGTFYITHDRGMGLVSFLDPTTHEVTEVAGFASFGLTAPTELLTPEED